MSDECYVNSVCECYHDQFLKTVLLYPIGQIVKLTTKQQFKA